VDTKRFKPLEKKTAEPLKILTVGNHIPGKQPGAIIRAVKQLPVELTVIGKGPLSRRLKELSYNQGTQNKIRFIDAVPNSLIHAEYQRHDVFCISIRHPGVCIPVLEAMACGLPVVTNQPLWERVPEVIGEHAVIVKNNQEGFAGGLKMFLEKPELIAAQGKKNRQIMEGISGQGMEAREQALFSSLLS
jgi:glycosyltransferase EpsD